MVPRQIGWHVDRCSDRGSRIFIFQRPIRRPCRRNFRYLAIRITRPRWSWSFLEDSLVLNWMERSCSCWILWIGTMKISRTLFFRWDKFLLDLLTFDKVDFVTGTLGGLLLLRSARSCEIKFVESVICVLPYVIGSCPLRVSQCLSPESHVYFFAIRSEHVTGRVSEPG